MIFLVPFGNKPRFQSNKCSFSNLSKECDTKSQFGGQGFGFDCIWWHFCERSWCVYESSWRQTWSFDFGECKLDCQNNHFLCLIEQLVWVWSKCCEIFQAVRIMLAERLTQNSVFERIPSWWPQLLCGCVIDCGRCCVDLHFHILKTIKPINKTHIFFCSWSWVLLKPKTNFKSLFYFVLFWVSWKFDSHSFFEILNCFFWLSKYDSVLRIYFIRGTSPHTHTHTHTTHHTHTHTHHTPHTHTHTHTRKTSLWFQLNFHSQQNRKKEHMFQLEHKTNNTKYFFFLSNPTFTNPHKQLFSFVFVWFDICWIEWWVLFCFFVFGIRSNMTNKRLMLMWWSLSLLFVLVVEIIDILLCDPKNTKWKDTKWNWNPTQHNTFSFPFIQKKQHTFVSISNPLADSSKRLKQHTSLSFPLFSFLLVSFALVVVFLVCLSHDNTKKTKSVTQCCLFAFCLHVFSVLAVLVPISDYVVFCASQQHSKRNRIVLCFFFGKKTNKRTSNSSMILECPFRFTM